MLFGGGNPHIAIDHVKIYLLLLSRKTPHLQEEILACYQVTKLTLDVHKYNVGNLTNNHSLDLKE